MQYSQLFTAWTRAMGEFGLEMTMFDFAHRWDEAQLFLAKLLPPAAVPELMLSVSFVGSQPSSVAIPGNVLEIHSVEMIPDVPGATTYRHCRIVSPAVFSELSMLSGDAISTRQGSRLLVSPPAAVEDGYVKIRYTAKMAPVMAVTPTSVFGAAALLRGSVSVSNKRLFRLIDPPSTVLPAGSYTGSRVYAANSQASEYGDPVTFIDTAVDMTGIVFGVTYFTLRDELPVSGDELYTLTVVPYHLATGSLAFPQLTSSPAPWSVAWHPILLDYALFKEFSFRESVERATLHLNRLNQALQLMGVNIQVGSDS